MPEPPNLTTEEDALLRGYIRQHNAAARQYESLPSAPSILDVVVQSVGVEQAIPVMERLEAEKTVERTRARYQTAWELVFRMHGLDFREWSVALDESEDRLDIAYVGRRA